MPTSRVSYAEVSDWFSTTWSKEITGVDWNDGDKIVVFGGLENSTGGTPTIQTPTNGNLTFSLITNVDTGNNESPVWFWYADANSNQTNQTITANSTSGKAGGFAVWVIRGGASGAVAWSVGNATESAHTRAAAAGSAILYGCGDWNANQSNQTITTGTGTGTEQTDDGDGSSWAVNTADWIDTTTTSADYGLSSYSGMQVQHIAIEIEASATGPTYDEPVSQTVALTPTTTDAQDYVDTPDQTVVLATSVGDVQAYVDQFTQVVVLDPTVSDAQTYVEALTQALVLLPTALDAQGYIEPPFTQTLTLLPTAVDSQNYVEQLAESFTLLATATDRQSYIEQLTQTVVLLATVLDETQGSTYEEQVSQILALTPTIVDRQGYADLPSQTLVLDPTVLDIQGNMSEQVFVTVVLLAGLLEAAETEGVNNRFEGRDVPQYTRSTHGRMKPSEWAQRGAPRQGRRSS